MQYVNKKKASEDVTTGDLRVRVPELGIEAPLVNPWLVALSMYASQQRMHATENQK